MPGKQSKTRKTVNKSAKTGRFVSEKAVQRSPSTTYKQSVKGGRKGR